MSYCITEINSFKIQSSPVRCFVAHRSCSKQTFKMTLAGRKGTEDESKWKHRMNLENRDWFQRLLWIGSWRGRSRGTPSPVELSSSFSLSSFFNSSFFQPIWYHGFSRELSLLDLLYYLMLQGYFHCKLSAAGNSVKDLGLVMQDKWHLSLVYWAGIKVEVTVTPINVGLSLQRAWEQCWVNGWT